MNFSNILDELFEQLNQTRINPSSQISKLASKSQCYSGLMLNNQIKTREGVNALNDLLNDLQYRQPSNKLKWSFSLHLAADQQAIKLGNNGLLTTEDTQYHQSLPNRCQKYSVIRGRITQVYYFGGDKGTDIIQQLLIDDGLASRKRRNTLLDPIYKFIGIGSSYHFSQKSVTVIILAQNVLNLVAPGSEGKLLKKTRKQQGKQFLYEILQERRNQNKKKIIKEKKQINKGAFILQQEVNYQPQQPIHYKTNQKQTKYYPPPQIQKKQKDQSNCMIF